MNNRFRYNFCPRGLGTIITQISFVLATGRPATAVVPNANNIVYDFKRIFQIDDLHLTIEQGTDGYPHIESDELCTYVPYLSSDTIQLFGQVFNTARKKKPCVGLAMHHGCGLGDAMPLKSMPYNKFGTAQEYNQIFAMLTNAGYDVLVINRADINIEQKIYLLNELCEFVVTYEGGVAHLAHCLKIPVFMLPWKYDDLGNDPSYPGILYESHRFHPDRKTKFLINSDEFLNWSKQELQNQVEILYNDGGNNILFDDSVVFDPTDLTIYRQGQNLTPRIIWCETRGAHAVEFIKAHLPIENMVKYPLKSTT